MNSLYHREGAYHYTKGINPRAIVALVLGVAIALVGLACRAAAFPLRLRMVRGLLHRGGNLYIALMKLVAPSYAKCARALNSAGSRGDRRSMWRRLKSTRTSEIRLWL